MKKLFFIIALNICINCLSFAQNTDREQLDRLTAHLALIQEDARMDRTIGGSVLIGAGVILGVGGVIITETTDDLLGDERFMYDAIFAGSGTLLVTAGVLMLVLPSDYELLPQRFQDLPEDSPENMRKKINTGEVYLETLAHNAERDRYLNGGILIASGLAQLVFYFFVPTEDVNDFYYVHDMFLYEGILNCGMGLLHLFIKSAPEHEYQSYREWKQSRGIAGLPDETQIRFALMPTRHGLTAALRLSF
ncbi:MAG: hypothetical protein JW822_13260 [Spirochaetales bacterium]|nr:hypothetical protein [Spirochaetales bacterium]